MSTLEIRQLPVLSDNYVYLIRCRATGVAAAIDPAEADSVLRALESLGWTLSYILNTHHHFDHTGGNEAVKAATGCQVVGWAADSDRLPGFDLGVSDGETFAIGKAEARIIGTPGHTRGHVSYWFPDSQALFCGDALFSVGCGRLFEDSAAVMWDSLTKLRALPGETKVYCAHEYTQSNITFALSVDPRNPALRARAAQVDALRAEDKPTIPSLLGDEVATNPFLRADDPGFQKALDMVGADPAEVFAATRTRKDRF